MEQVHTKYTQKILGAVGGAQTKVGAKLELKSPAKRILSVTPICHVNAVESTESEHKVCGKVITRAIFIDETDCYNSEERSDDFAITIPGAGYCGVAPSVRIIETNADRAAKNEADAISSISCDHVVGANLAGLKPTEIAIVSNVTGDDIEVKHTEREICTFNDMVTEKFDIGEIFKLDSSTEGVLGVELNATVRDIISKDEKVTIKGVAFCAVSVVKATDDGKQTMQNQTYDFEFSKTLKATGEIVMGNVCVHDCNIKIEHREKPELVLDASLLFTGFGVKYQTIKSVEDAIAPKNEIDFTYVSATNTSAIKQAGVLADIEGNVALGPNAPFMSRVLWSSCGQIGAVNVKPADDKVTVEGILSANLVYECEEHQIHTHTAEVPFSVNVKVDGASAEHNIGANVVPLSCNIKARRGKELLVDARLGVTVCANRQNDANMVTTASLGALKPENAASIVIHVVQAGETLWDLAKRTGVNTREIIKQNAGIENGLTGGERVVTYKRKAV